MSDSVTNLHTFQKATLPIYMAYLFIYFQKPSNKECSLSKICLET